METEISSLSMPVYLGAHNIISPLAYSSAENFTKLCSGESALKEERLSFSESPFVCAQLNNQELSERFREQAQPSQFTKLEQLCVLSVADVVKQTGIDLSAKDTLLILSTTKGNIDVLENRYPSLDPKRAYLTELAKVLSSFFKCANEPIVLSNACISGLLAMIVAQRYLQKGGYKHVLVCGADLLTEFTLSGFKSFNALSASRCKPFDAHRDGINLGEAAATLLLSTEPISRLLITAGASANDANHISGPSRSGEGLYQAIQTACKNLKADDIGFISAHGTATEYNDEMEAVAFHRAGFSDIPLHSLKAYYGHTLGAAGVLESIVSLMCLDQNVLLASLGYEQTGTSHAVNAIRNTQTQALTRCLKTASGFGGCNAAAIFEKI